MTTRLAAFCCLISTILFPLAPAALGQANSWSDSASGNWEDSHWSLDSLPGMNQAILFTNDGNKTLTIGSNTVQNFPGTLNVNSITISSPPNSFNTLLLNSAGAQSPLTAQSILVASNSTMTMVSSALELDGGNGVGMQVGGEFNQSDSLVSGRQVNVGYVGPGVYNLNSGMLAVSNLWVGGSFDGVFNQTGGTNNTGIVGLDPGGTYNFSGGEFNATVYFSDSSTFHQTGGEMNQALSVSEGTYLQSGGTNFGWLSLGSGGSHLVGNYVLSNGCAFLPSLNIGTFGTFHQFGGTAVVTNTIYFAPHYIDYGFRGYGFTPGGNYWLSGGTLMAGGMAVDYLYTQDGGTNIVTGDIVTTNFEPVSFAGIQLKGGVLKADNITLSSEAALQLMGGSLVVNNLITTGQVPPSMASFGPDINLIGGELTISNIDVEMDYLAISGTTVKQTGTLTLGGISTLLPGAGTHTFGPLIPDSGVIIMGTNVDCQLHFANSSSLEWSNAWLIIKNWSGSIYGGGAQQIFFGTNAAGLTTNQLSRIIFENIPVAVPPSPSPFFEGGFQAKILATGEIVPDTGAPLPPQMAIACSLTNSAMQLTLGGDIGQSYDIEVSTDLVNWTWWTNEFNTNGTIYLNDSGATNYPQRFYRASPVP